MWSLRSVLTIFIVAVIAFLMPHDDVIISLKKVFDSRYCQWIDKDGETNKKPGYDLAVGILSSRDHFDARAAIRETWLKELHGNGRGRGWFVVGDTDCDLHPDSREDQYCCKEWEVSVPVKSEDVQVVTTEKVTVSEHHFGKDRKPVQVLHFKVMNPVVVSRIGLLERALLNTSAIQVSLFDRSTDEALTTATFSGTDPGIPRGQFLFQPVDAVKLPKGFEGYLNVDLDTDQVVDLNDKLPSLTFTTIVSNLTGVLKLQELSSSSVELWRGHTQQPVHLMSMVLAVEGMDVLRQQVSTRQKMDRFWKKKRATIDSKLRQEAEKYGDLLFVNVTDVYRNLPTKLLLFHQWLYNHINANNVLKTDDDCFVNIGSVMSALSQINIKDGDIWWGSFRDQWLVEQWGKWSELTYTADVYPRFACGAGNIVSRDIHTWLGRNGNYLKTYQGEDVSMGIWMSAVKLTFIKDDRWKCDKNCSPDSLAIPELSPQEVRTMWTNKETCADLCGCGG
ncbi:UDP-GalNAc:beta-1,3-N-acetylgalactosaminyltransferase 2-like [Pecten maximus]|uniref:UDP-GalNAc:beta-1, 3-N-acetylgalactosaminyltransferase 2-like n=1 Tax=Pecten maximus TaxID=6579 RepID=UPI001458852B|nr:UDP-GalNAc:beta-1,3-N-acetylgalactosaminyltransferase 2-like [Pecten maximus]